MLGNKTPRKSVENSKAILGIFIILFLTFSALYTLGSVLNGNEAEYLQLLKKAAFDGLKICFLISIGYVVFGLLKRRNNSGKGS